MIDIDRFQITEDHSAGKYTIHFKCNVCHKPKPVTVQGSELYKYRQGALVQEAFPYLISDERELFISGTCGSCYDEMFADDTEDDYS